MIDKEGQEPDGQVIAIEQNSVNKNERVKGEMEREKQRERERERERERKEEEQENGRNALERNGKAQTIVRLGGRE